MPLSSADPRRTCSPYLPLALLPFFGRASAPQCPSCIEGPHQCQVQEEVHFPTPADHAVPDTSQDAIGLLCHLGTLLAHVQPAVDQHPQVLFCWAVLQPLLPKLVALHGVVVTQVQDLALSLVESHAVALGPLIRSVQILLQSLPTHK